MLIISETHPVPYHAPVYRVLSQELGVPIHVLYGSNFSVRGYFDREFCARFAWSANVLDGYPHSFVRTVEDGGAIDYDTMTATGVREAIAALDPKMILALGYHHPLDRATIRTAFIDKVPLIFRGETTDYAQDRTLVRRFIRDLVLRPLYQRCTKLLYIGSMAHSHYLRLGCPESKLLFSPYCVAGEGFRHSTEQHSLSRRHKRHELGIADDSIVVLFAGKLSERKGVDLLPLAIRLLPKEIRDKVHLLFLGDGVLREQLSVACGHDPVIKTSFVGFQNQSALSGYYHAADLLVLPSRTMETWGLVVNEALLHGLPCVVSECVGSHPDLVIPGKTGAVCKSNDPGSLAAAIAAVIRQVDEPGLAERCQRQVHHFTVRAAAEGIRCAWQSLDAGSSL